MSHNPLQIIDLALSFPHKNCFDHFNTDIRNGDRIGIIGRNGCGKSSLLKILQGIMTPTHGEIRTSVRTIFGYVPQIIEEYQCISGGQIVNKALTKALNCGPDILLLDEPTNHLDHQNRLSLMRLLQSYRGTLIIVTHDPVVLRTCVDTLWHIDQGKIHAFYGSYDDYMQEITIKRASLEQQVSRLDQQKKQVHHLLMKEQTRAAKSKSHGKKNAKKAKWPPIVGKSKGQQAEETLGRKRLAIDHRKQDLTTQLLAVRLPEVIVPKFSLNASVGGNRLILSIANGTIEYKDQPFFLNNINLSLVYGDKIALKGPNGCGKSTLIKAICTNTIVKTGDWQVPLAKDIGYLDQQYATLSLGLSVFETIASLNPTWNDSAVRSHLNDFLFRKTEEIMATIETLSGGERARLCLAQIAAKTPKLLVLDELTNNLDLETRTHVIQVLKNYPESIIAISHDEEFLQEIGIHNYYSINPQNKGFL